MSKNLNLLLQGPSSFSPSKILSLNHELNSINDSSAIELNCYEFYSVDIAQDFSDHVKLLELLKLYKIPLKKVAIELNEEIIDKKKISKIKLKKNDKIEIVHFIGGG